MATSYVSFNEGTARKVRTFQRTDGANTVEEWMYAESEPTLDTYSVQATNIAGVTADSHLLEVMAGASLRVGIRRIRISQFAAASTTRLARFGVYRLTTAGTGGTAVTPLPLDPASGTVGATAMTLASSKGTEAATAVGGIHSNVIQSTITNQLGNPILDLDFGREREKALWIAAGASNGICIKNLVADATVTYDIYTTFVEAGWA